MPDGRPEGEPKTLRCATACAAPAVLIGLAALLPFLGKAFTIDDVTFLLQAKHLLVDPLHPTAFDMVFQGVRLRLSHVLVSGPVMAYLLVPSVALGGAEWAAHLVQISFLSAGAIATASLALRLGLDRTQAVVASLLVVTSPAVLGMSATAMPDVPAMALAVAGMERLYLWRQTGRWAAGMLAGMLLALAALSRPHVVLVFGCAFFCLIEGERTRWRVWRWPAAVLDRRFAPIAVALALTALAVWITRDPASGDTVAGATIGRVQAHAIVFHLANFAMHWVVSFPLVLLWALIRGPKLMVFPRAPLAFNFGVLLAVSGGFLLGEGWWHSLPIVLLVGIATVVLCDIICDAWQRRDETQLMLGAWLLIAASAATYVQLPPKLLVPSAPAMALLIARELNPLRRGPLQFLFVCTTVVASLALGVLIIRADSALANIGREGGQVVARQVKAGARTWMDGAWGFQWYAMKEGAQPLAETEPFPQEGDVVVASLQARLLQADFPNKTLLSQKVFAGPGGRVNGEGAGFFADWGGPWPWVWGRKELGRIEVWRIDSSHTAPR